MVSLSSSKQRSTNLRIFPHTSTFSYLPFPRPFSFSFLGSLALPPALFLPSTLSSLPLPLFLSSSLPLFLLRSPSYALPPIPYLPLTLSLLRSPSYFSSSSYSIPLPSSSHLPNPLVEGSPQCPLSYVASLHLRSRDAALFCISPASLYLRSREVPVSSWQCRFPHPSVEGCGT